MKAILIWFKRSSAIALATLVIAGCNVGPRYNRPTVSTPPAFRGADDASIVSDAQNSVADQQWSEVFREPELQALIRTALTNNYDIRIAARRVLEQQAQVQITRSQEFPQVTGGGTGVGATLPSNLGVNIASPLAFGSFNLGAAWNPDFWGLYRKQTEAARAQLFQQGLLCDFRQADLIQVDQRARDH